jgi:hypothetical protein
MSKIDFSQINWERPKRESIQGEKMMTFPEGIDLKSSYNSSDIPHKKLISTLPGREDDDFS